MIIINANKHISLCSEMKNDVTSRGNVSWNRRKKCNRRKRDIVLQYKVISLYKATNTI